MEGDDLAMVIKFADSAQVVSNYTSDRRTLASRSTRSRRRRRGRRCATGCKWRRGWPTRPSRSVRAWSRRRSSHPSFSSTPTAASPTSRVSVLAISSPKWWWSARRRRLIRHRRRREHVPPMASAQAAQSVRQCRDHGAPNPPRRRQARSLSALWPGAQLPCRGGFHRSPALPAVDRQERGGNQARRCDRAQDSPQTDQSFNLDLPDTGLAAFEVRLTVRDALEVDNHAFTVAGRLARRRCLRDRPGNRYLTDTLRTPAATERADVTIVSPEELKNRRSPAT